jgi:hypothetical protein
MIREIMQYFNRYTVVGVIITAIISLFYSYIMFGIYILGLIVVIILRYKWAVFDIKKLNSALKNIAISVVTIFWLTILCEIWLQLYPHRFSGIDGVDTVGNFSDYTSRGYLTKDIFNKGKDVFRILNLGDSFSIFLKDKGQNYNDFLQQQFVGSGKSEVEIVNAGMEGMGPGYYWYALNKYGDLFKPDLVLVGFFVGNDFEEADFEIIIGNYISEPQDFIKRYSRYYQFSRLRLYRLLKNKYTRYREAHLKEQEAKRHTSQQVGNFSQATFLGVEKKRSWIFDRNNRELLHQEWRECSAVILKMKDWCDRRKIKLVIAILPDQFQVDQALREAVIAKYGHIAENNLDLSYPDNLIVNFCRTHNIHCLDLLGPFQEQGKTRPLYAHRDSHWNAAGNRLAADLIFEYLGKNQLLPPRPRQ